MEKLNRGSKCSECVSYNEIYESHTQLFLDLLQPRLGATYDYYVRMPEIESEIMNYIQSGTRPVCLFSGLTGIGKTSVLTHIKHSLSNNNNVHCVYIDLVGRRANLELGEDFYELDEKAAQKRAESVASSYLIRMLLGSFRDKINIEEWGENFYDFIMKDEEKAHLIYHLSMHSSKADKLSILNSFREQNPVGHAYTALKFYCYKTNKNHIVIMLDNTDQKDFELIEAFVNVLADFNVCINRGVDKITSIISCRPYNEKRLQKRREINSLSTHGDRPISLSKPCRISRIISERKRVGNFTTNPLYISTSKGAKWTVRDVDDFIDNLTARYEEEGLEDLVMELNNYDLSLAFDNTVNILKNRHFISAERLLPNVINEKSDLPFGVSASAVLKSLAYGNPKTKKMMFYPSESSKMPIPNLLNWNPDREETFLSKFRVIQFLAKRKAYIDRNGINQEILIEALSKCFDIDQEISIKCLKAMYFEKLIFTHSNREPSNRNSDFIVMSPRGNLIYGLCSKSSLMAEFWFDDTPLNDEEFDGTFMTIKFKERYSSLVRFVSFVWKREREQLLRILKQPGIREYYKNNFNGEVVSKRLLRGVRSSREYYPLPENRVFEEIKTMFDDMDEIASKLFA